MGSLNSSQLRCGFHDEPPPTPALPGTIGATTIILAALSTFALWAVVAQDLIDGPAGLVALETELFGQAVPYGWAIWASYLAAVAGAVVTLGWSTWRWYTRSLPYLAREARREARDLGLQLHHANERHTALRHELARASALLDEERTRTERLLGTVPTSIISYYQGGQNEDRGTEALRTTFAREAKSWEALSGTFHTGALEPVFTAMAALVHDRERGIHHYATDEVMARFAEVSSGLRNNDWLGKALRWMEAKYGT